MAQLKFTTRTEGFGAVAQRLAQASTAAEHALAERVATDTERFVPFVTGSLADRTKVIGNMIVYPAPMSRYLYFGKLMVDPETGSAWAKEGVSKVKTDRNLVFTRDFNADAQSHWFEASKAVNLEKWKKQAKKLLINEYKHK